MPPESGERKDYLPLSTRRNIKLILAYEGTNYRGWQFQPGEPTIQGIVQEKISIMTREKVVLVGAGRTDSGVHALGQVASFYTTTRIPVEGFLRGLNSLLPADIVIRRVEEMPYEFHPRYNAASKVYLYIVRTSDLPDPFWHRFSWTVKGDVDGNLMNSSARSLLGERDFSVFCASGGSTSNPVRTVIRARWRKMGRDRLIFEIEANGFLRHMVRSIVGTLVEIGLGKKPGNHLERILEGKNRQEAGITAPARGLFLKEVRYPS